MTSFNLRQIFFLLAVVSAVSAQRRPYAYGAPRVSNAKWILSGIFVATFFSVFLFYFLLIIMVIF